MKLHSAKLMFSLLAVRFATGCDSFAPPPERRFDPSPVPVPTATSPFPVTPQPTGTPTSTTTNVVCSVLVDRDGDGYTIADCPGGTVITSSPRDTEDCDDFNASRHKFQTLYVDQDRDGLGSSASSLRVCEYVVIDGFVDNASDCLDTDPTKQFFVYLDGDGDHYGGPNSTCAVESANWVRAGGDCADEDPNIHPNAEEVLYDGVDTNCDAYDVPVIEVDAPSEVIAWTGGALCEGSALAVVALERGTSPPGEAYLHIGNVGSTVVSDATLLLSNRVPERGLTSVAVPRLAPGEVVRTERIAYGHYELSFEYLSKGPEDPVADAAADVDARSNVDSGVSAKERCDRTQEPFEFVSTLLEPL